MSTAADSTPRRRVATSDLIGTGILAVVGLIATIMGINYGFLQEGGVIGPGFLPVLVGGFILVASLAEIGRMFLVPQGHGAAGLVAPAEEAMEAAESAQSEAHGGEERDTFGRTSRQRSIAIVMIFGFMLIALLLVPVLGLLLSLTALMLAIMIVVERKPILNSVLVTGAALGVAYLIFVVGLNVPVPTGMLGLI